MENIGASEENLQNDENTKQKEEAERIQILESEVESKKKEADITISKLKQLLEEKEQCILKHKKQEKNLKHQIFDDHRMKHDQSTMLKILKEIILKMSMTLEVSIEEFQHRFRKHKIHFSDVSLQKDKAVEAFAETEERCHKILADCGEESTRQHIQELVTHMQQCHSEQLKSLRETTNAVWTTIDSQILLWKYTFADDSAALEEEMDELLMGEYENSDSDDEIAEGKFAKIDVKKQMGNETTATERFQILESKVESKKEEADITISTLKQLLEEKEQCILKHRELEKKLKHQISDYHYIKYGQSTMLKHLRKEIFKMFRSFVATFEELTSDFQDKFKKHKKHFPEVSVQKDKAVEAFAETEERCRKILADCGEESTRQHIQELVTHMQQCHSEQLKSLREATNAVWTKFDGLFQAWKNIFEHDGLMLKKEMEELMGDYESSDSD